jgi:hypothetical protein
VAWPIAAGWLVLSIVLGRVQERRAALTDGEGAKLKGASVDATTRDDVFLGDADIGVASEGGAITGERA